MFKRLNEIVARYEELESLLSDASVLGRQTLYQKYAREHAELQDLVETFREYQKTNLRIEEGQALLRENDEELKTIVK